MVAAVESDPETLVLHAVRLLGFAESERVASRFAQDPGETHELILDLEAHGWVSRSEFAGASGWSLTERGRAEDERRLADELDAAGIRPVVEAAHERFVPLNTRFQEAATRWQIRPLPGRPMAANDHTDHRWDDRVVAALASVGRRLRPIEVEVSAALPRFAGYSRRYDRAFESVLRGDGRWVDGVGIDSCHVVWMQLHEDLLATLGLPRGQEWGPV